MKKKYDIKQLTANISLFSGEIVNISQLNIILIGCGFPKSQLLNKVFREYCCTEFSKKNIEITNVSSEKLQEVLKEYSKRNIESVNYYAKKKQAKLKAINSSTSIAATRFYIINGVLTTEKPEKE